MFSKNRETGLNFALLILGLSVGLAGCSENWNSIYRTPGGSTNVGVITDAKQRVVLNVPGNGPAKGNVVCAEPSPDVAQALSTALTLSAQATQGTQPAPGGGTGNIGGGSAGANFGLSTAASIAQLGERLAVIQLLRDKMYRACEAYANGAISPASYTLTLARFDKTMTTLLSAEMAAGAFGRKLAGVGGSAVSDGVNAQQLMDANTKVAAAKTAHGEASDADKPTKLKTLSAAQAELIDLLAKGMATSASGSVNADIGTMQTVKAVGGIAEIHRAYMDDSGVEPLIDACLTVMTVDALNINGGPGFENAKSALIDAQKRLDEAKTAQALHTPGTGGDDPTERAVSQAEKDVAAASKKVNEPLGVGDASASVDKAKQRLALYQSPFVATCEIFMNGGADEESLIKRLIAAKNSYLDKAIEMQKVVSASEALKACNELTKGKEGADLKAALAICQNFSQPVSATQNSAGETNPVSAADAGATEEEGPAVPRGKPVPRVETTPLAPAG